MSAFDPEVKSTLCDTLGNSSTLVIGAVLIIVVVSMFVLPDSKELVSNALAGLFGIAVGKSVK